MDGVEWDEVMLEIREYMSNYLNAGQPILTESAQSIALIESDEDIGQTDHVC